MTPTSPAASPRPRRRLLLAAGLLGLCGAWPALAQQTGLLYDPDPPADSAYVRVIVAAPGAPLDLAVDGKARLTGLRFGEPSDYLVLPAGAHTLTLAPGKGAREAVRTAIQAPKGRAVTIALMARDGDGKPLVFEDKANANKLKAVLGVYHLAGGAPLDVLAGSGGQAVFPALEAGKAAYRSVNPISVDLALAAPGGGERLAATSLSMDFGGTYSLLILPGEGGKPRLTATLNKVERYTGK